MYRVESFYDAGISANYLHINNVSLDCDEGFSAPVPYRDALVQCEKDKRCVLVTVKEFDVYESSYGKSSLCYSTNMNGIYSVKRGLISIKADKCSMKDAFHTSLNRRGICKPGQLVGELHSLTSFSDAARECQRLKCDYFTVSILQKSDNLASSDRVSEDESDSKRVNSAWVCIGKPTGMYSEGFIMAQRL
ncbi:hypothetical protein BEWA_040930 [Theileria equi strain WA]|uniref:PAN domain protein n=1 Tax=Theileria equi strain WA TaxID=1537102 RepID=L1LFM3_THEEQ|nr:hypothetical protein BEWA_040930 [Theileria equi strain WA]EKX74055.1 hypothetical protein BEWA_040930 [Theileria equi strain WA]|eukprot:XP_004833507.1 hypothetical protein BEWA_040930 [Theileria equi strain WA]